MRTKQSLQDSARRLFDHERQCLQTTGEAEVQKTPGVPGAPGASEAAGARRPTVDFSHAYWVTERVIDRIGDCDTAEHPPPLEPIVRHEIADLSFIGECGDVVVDRRYQVAVEDEVNLVVRVVEQTLRGD